MIRIIQQTLKNLDAKGVFIYLLPALISNKMVNMDGRKIPEEDCAALIKDTS